MPKKATITQSKYDAANCRNYHLKLVIKTDSDIINKLSTVPSIQGYIKTLIRQDIAQAGTDPEGEKQPVNSTKKARETETIEGKENTMTIRDLALNWIENADSTPGQIDIETAAQYISWIDPEQLPDDITPKSFMDAWNDIVSGN